MTAPVFLTIDTELTWRHQARGLSWEENFRRSYDAAGVGVPWQLQVLRRHGLRACFFVDPMPALVHGLGPAKRMVEPILAAGQDVQLHLHPFWADLAAGRPPRFELTGMDEAEQAGLIRTARDLLVEAGAPAPVAFRAGSYAADGGTLRGLCANGIQYDSSLNASHPRVSRVPSPSALAPRAVDGVAEFPVGQIAAPDGPLRHLQIAAVSGAELEGALAHAKAEAHPLITIVGHSFELARRDGLRPVSTLVRRFERLCATLERHGHPTLGGGDLRSVPLDREMAPAVSPRLRRAARQAEQAWVNMRHERPAELATAAAGTGMVGLEALLLIAAIE